MYTIFKEVGCDKCFFDEPREEKGYGIVNIDRLGSERFNLWKKLLTLAYGTDKKLWEKSLKLDVYYTKNVSLTLDISILCKTIELLLSKRKQYNDFKRYDE